MLSLIKPCSRSLPRETSKPGASSQSRRGSGRSIPGFSTSCLPAGRSKPQHPAAPCAAGRYRGAEAAQADPGAGPAPCALGPSARLPAATTGWLERQSQASATDLA